MRADPEEMNLSAQIASGLRMLREHEAPETNPDDFTKCCIPAAVDVASDLFAIETIVEWLRRLANTLEAANVEPPPPGAPLN